MPTRLLALAFLSIVYFPYVAAAGTLVTETSSPVSLAVRLLTPLSSYTSKAGEPVTALIATPVCAGRESWPAGVIVRGVLKRIHGVGLGLAHETAAMELEFRTVNFPDTRSYPVDARITSVDNARERVDRHGIIHGIRATDTLSSRFSSHLFFAVHAHPALALPSLLVESWLFRFPDPEITYSAGTAMWLEVRFPPELGTASACSIIPPEQEHSEELERLASNLPLWSYSKQHRAMDRVNLVFVGSRDQVEHAFRAAGWLGSQPNSWSSGFQAVRAIVEGQRYADAPMRTLLLDGAEPDLRFQRSLNTFDKRDHLRIWQRPEEWQGQTVWASAATQDIAATFGVKPLGFTHRIQNKLDLERGKVVSDLELTGCVDSVLFSGPTIAQPLRKGLETDERIAIVLLNACEAPREWPAESAEGPQPPLQKRALRRVILTARNHFLRDNYWWRAGESLKVGWHAFRTWEQRRHSGSGL
ncbi:MAG: LssY C-terminal domain-containing protein [Acidobacteriia bacterium]|nr:LssY C-terminal domain-containing protein [Terriglobia bacterium]